MSLRQYFIPGKGYINETNQNQFMVGPWGFLDSTSAISLSVSPLTAVSFTVI